MWVVRRLQPSSSTSLGFSLNRCRSDIYRWSYRPRRPGLRLPRSSGDLKYPLETATTDLPSSIPSPMFYSDFPLDRAEHLRYVISQWAKSLTLDRKRPEELERLAVMPEAELLPWQSSECLFIRDKDLYEPILLRPFSKYVEYLDPAMGHLFLGLHPETQTPVFAGSVADVSAFTQAMQNGSMEYKWMDIRVVGPQIRSDKAALIACANGMMEWHTRNIYCGRSGKPSHPIYGGYSRKTSDNGLIIFPRIDPAVICLVTCGDYCLLGRKANWNERTRYSLLSGFLEIGETLEQAAEREVLEESNIRVDPSTIVYKGSQPWPFPQSMMVGFTAELLRPSMEMHLSEDAKNAATETYVTEEEMKTYLQLLLPTPIPQPDEIEDVRWFHRSYMEAQLNATSHPEFGIPGPHAIGHQIIHGWLTDRSSAAGEWKGNQLSDVVIDEGTFKYVLGRVVSENASKIVVRGKRGRSHHKDVFKELQSECQALGLKAEPVGGGRIEHDPIGGSIEIYGSSAQYGTAVHDITAVLCHRAFPFYDRIEVAYSGY